MKTKKTFYLVQAIEKLLHDFLFFVLVITFPILFITGISHQPKDEYKPVKNEQESSAQSTVLIKNQSTKQNDKL